MGYHSIKSIFVYAIILLISFQFVGERRSAEGASPPVSNIRTKSKKLIKQSYVIQEGDNLIKIAKKLNTTVASLKKLNQLKGDIIVARQKLFYLTKKDSSARSIELPSNGSLKNGEKLREIGRGYMTKNEKNLYGTNKTVKYIKKCSAEYRITFPKNPPLVIGDLSKKNGGSLPPHLSHQSGRDVDIGYLLKSRKKFNEFVETTPENIDEKRTWSFIQCLLNTKDVKYIFMTKSLQVALYKYLLKKKVSKKRLSKIMEYPNGTGDEVILRISNDHINHFHVRFKCPKGDKDCRD